MTDAAYKYAETRGQPGAPLLLTFHGTGGNEHQFHSFAERLIPGAHVVSPRGDVLEGGMNCYFRRTGEGVYDMADLARRRDRMAAFIRDHNAEKQAGHVAGLGYSNGANILMAVALENPDLVDRLVLMHPLIPWSPEPQPGLAGRRVLITAGRRDPICPAPLTQALADFLSAQGADVTLEWHSGGHEITQGEVQAVTDFMAG
ncbi:alpha/beta hydrolase [Seohaeicola saemankumensis]|uniref:alpha/beta hydrolase n=1 Tax=Seohaeicola saemankumensis TaxID=481181 RepID=UPI001E3B0749|nr:alpha/beta hydrolase [Seohaeicola saemankumensis]MCD1626185.1 alpha/beta hydrolase [Seohaeicola saemankumensis]